MADAPDWRLPAPAEQCARCESALEVGADCTVVLAFGEEGPTREDLCATCGEVPSDDPAAVFWRHKVPTRDASRPVVDYALLREMFERMLGRSEPAYQRLSYLVALVLLRKRSLRLRGFEVRDGKEVMVVVRKVGEPELIVPAPLLDAEALVETREQLTRLLHADLPADATTGELPSLEVDPEPEAAAASEAEAAEGDDAAEDSGPELN